MSDFVKRQGPMLLIFILGMSMFAEFYFKIPTNVVNVLADLKNFVIIIAAFALGIGAITLLLQHGRAIVKRQSGQWFYSLWLLVVMFVFIIVGNVFGTSSSQYTWVFMNFYTANDQTIYSLIGWLVVYALYLTFRARNYETLYLLGIALFTMMGNAPFGPAIWPGFTEIQSWLATVPNTAGLNGFGLALALGSIIISIRTIAGMERAAIGG